MSTPDPKQNDELLERKLRIQQQIAFASGLFQGDITIRTLLESLAEGVVIIDSSGTILLVNTRAEQMFGYPKKDLIGKSHAVLIPERFRKVHEEHQAHFFAEPRIRPMGLLLDLAGRRRDGSEFPLEISLSHLETINGVLVLAFVSDITLRQQYESHLRESEELSHILVEGVKDYAIFMLDAQGNVRSWNAGAEHLKGYRAEEIIGRHYSCFYPEEERDAGKPADELEKAAAEGRVEDESWRVRKDGSRFWADVIITALRDENGDLRGFSNVTRDITERKRAVESIRFSEARYRALFRDNPAMIFTLDTEWTILSANPFAASQLGYTIDELEGQSMLKLFHDDDRPVASEQLRGCVQNPNQVYRWQFRKVRKDGRLLWVDESAQTVHDLNGAPNVLVVCQNVTERKQEEEEREQLLVQFDAVLNSINEGVVISDLEGNILTMNPSALKIHEYENVEQVRRQLYQYQDTFELSDLDGSLVAFEQWPLALAIRGERFTDYEVRVRRKDTGKMWIGSYSGTPVQTRSGQTILSVVTLRDISERKQAQEALRKSELKLSRIFHSVPVIIGITTLEEGRCIDINDRGLQALGYQREEIIGRTMLELGVWENKSARDRVIQVLEEDGMVRDLEINFRSKSGAIFTGLFSAEPVDFNGERYLLVIVKDITERKRMEEEIERLNTDLAERAAKLEDANRELEAFNYSVSHDLRAPLSVISGYTQIIQQVCGDDMEERCKTYLPEISKGVSRMTGLIDALLGFSRVLRSELRRETVNLSAVAKEIVEELVQTAPERRTTVRIAEGIEVNGDASLLRVALGNLLGNAWKFTSQQEEAVIEFGVTTVGEETAYFVRDNGPGFDMAEVEKLFVPFQRLSEKAEFAGHGIGLATVERIIRRHGGRVWAEGEVGKGATFYFTL